MGFLNSVASAILVFKADTSDLEAKLKKVGGMEKTQLEATLQATKARNQGLKDWASNLANVNQMMELGGKSLDLIVKGIQFAAEAWKEYEKQAKKAGGAEAERAGKMRDAVDAANEAWKQFQFQVGKSVASLAPLIEQLANVLALVTHIGEGMGGFGNRDWLNFLAKYGTVDAQSAFKPRKFGEAVTSELEDTREIQHEYRVREAKKRRKEVEDAFYAEKFKSHKMRIDEIGKLLLPKKKKTGPGYDILEHGGREIEGIDARGMTIDQGWFDAQLAWMQTKREREDLFADVTKGIQGPGGPGWKSPLSGGELDALAKKAAGIGDELRREHKESVLESIFGPVDEFDLYAEKMEGLQETVSIFGSALQTGFDAWVDGSKTAVQAIKAAFGQTIMGIASSLFAHAIEHGAAAIGALAWGNLPGAAAHGKAAATYTGGALAVGGIARLLGAGSWGSGAGGSAGTGATSVNYSAGGGGGGSGGSSQIFYIGDGFGRNSPRFERQHAERSYKLAKRSVGESSTVRWS